MRTTLTLEADVAERIRQEAKACKGGLKAVINARLRRGFGLLEERERGAFRVEPHRSGYRPGVDALKLNQLVDELEVERFRAGGKAG